MAVAKKAASQKADVTAAAPRKGANIGWIERGISLAGGGLLALIGLNRKEGGPLKSFAFLAGGVLFYRGLTGRSMVYQALRVNRKGENQAVHIERTGTIGKSAEELYTFWHNFANLPHFMQHLETVTVTDATHSHWVAKAPAGKKVEWDAEIIEDKPNEVIAWRSLPGSGIANDGRVTFTAAPDGRGTEVKVVMDYVPPAGSLGVAIAKLTGEEPTEQVGEDLRHFKMLMEADQIISTYGQPTGRPA